MVEFLGEVRLSEQDAACCHSSERFLANLFRFGFGAGSIEEVVLKVLCVFKLLSSKIILTWLFCR